MQVLLEAAAEQPNVPLSTLPVICHVEQRPLLAHPAAAGTCSVCVIPETVEPVVAAAPSQQRPTLAAADASCTGSVDLEMAKAAQEAAPSQQAVARAATARASVVPETMELGVGGAPMNACTLDKLNTVQACGIPLAALLRVCKLHVDPLVLGPAHCADCWATDTGGRAAWTGVPPCNPSLTLMI